MRRKTIILLATIATLSLGVVLAWPRISFYMLTRRFSPIHKIETLQNPVTVSSGAGGFASGGWSDGATSRIAFTAERFVSTDRGYEARC